MTQIPANLTGTTATDDIFVNDLVIQQSSMEAQNI